MEENFCFEKVLTRKQKKDLGPTTDLVATPPLFFFPIAHFGVPSFVTWSSCPMVLEHKMGKPKENSDSKRKRKRVAVESSSDDDESEQDLEEVNAVVINFKVFW